MWVIYSRRTNGDGMKCRENGKVADIWVCGLIEEKRLYKKGAIWKNSCLICPRQNFCASPSHSFTIMVIFQFWKTKFFPASKQLFHRLNALFLNPLMTGSFLTLSISSNVPSSEIPFQSNQPNLGPFSFSITSYFPQSSYHQLYLLKMFSLSTPPTTRM